MSKQQTNPYERLIEWIMLNVIFALLPLLLAWIMHWLGNATSSPGAYTPEVLFFAISLSAIAIGNLYRLRHETATSAMTAIFMFGLLICAIGAAVLYGANLYDGILSASNGSSNGAFRGNLARLANKLGVVLFLVALAVETYIARTQSKAQGVVEN